MQAIGDVEELRPVVLSSEHTHDRFGTKPADLILNFRAYTASFDIGDDDNADGTADLLGVPQWVAYQLNAGPVIGPNERPEDWIPVPEFSPSPTDDSYRNSGYSRGHMCRRAHAHRLGSDANYNSYCVANACPQIQSFNAGHWLGLEDFCSIWANLHGRVWVICGPVFDGLVPADTIGDGDETRVGISEHFFKIVIRENPENAGRPLILAFLYPHSAALNDRHLDVDHTPFLRSVDEIEALTGLDFFTSLEDEVECELERQRSEAIWSLGLEEGIENLLVHAFGPEDDIVAAVHSLKRKRSLLVGPPPGDPELLTRPGFRPSPLIDPSSTAAGGRFEGAVIAKWLEHLGPDRMMELVEDFAYVDPTGKRWLAPKGSVVDGASIPAFFWNLYVGPPFIGDYRRASVVHDVACDLMNSPHKQVHRMFFDACLSGGVDEGKAKAMYWAVRTFGPRWSMRPSVVQPSPAMTPETLAAAYQLHEEIVENPDLPIEEIESRLDRLLSD